ncbi:MAG TPA: M20/M25/M40 family metallo-hydrolase [Solirubrobacteraceae bacterium]|nr:M20/M25/M40 family metallo-hydrolase [Solirubrobacteraceae bacterium]
MSFAVGEDARRRLHDTFVALCRIPSPTGDERVCADWITAELQQMGLTVQEDGAGAEVGGNTGNLLVRIPGASDRSILFCSHMDTVPLTAPVDPAQSDGGWINANEGILGADNKAAVAAMIELARLLTADATSPPVGVELLFTVAEETGINGAREFDVTRLHSQFGYVFDHASPWGEIISASPTYMRVTAEIRGRAAHAGLQPEQGVNAIVAAAHAVVAMPQGRLDAETTANVGTIFGGTATNVVADRCVLEAEVRGLDLSRVDAVVAEMVDALQDGADSAGCDLDLAVEKMFTGYRVAEREESVRVAQRALRQLGIEPRLVPSGGGADANAFRLNGFQCTNIANGTERAHQRTERVSNVALETGLEILLALIQEVAA